MQFNKPIIITLPKPIKAIWSYIRQWIKTWFYVLLLNIITWPIFIPLADWIFHPDDGGGLCVICGRELALLSLSLLFAYWFWVGILSFKRFTKTWQRILSIVLFFIAHYVFTFFQEDLLVSEVPIIAICLPLGVLICLAWQRYSKKFTKKDFYKKAILVIKKIVALIIIRVCLNLVSVFLINFDLNKIYHKAIIYVLLLASFFVAYIILKKFFTLIFARILIILMIISSVFRYFIATHYRLPIMIISLIFFLIIIVVAIWDGVLVIKKEYKKVNN